MNHLKTLPTSRASLITTATSNALVRAGLVIGTTVLTSLVAKGDWVGTTSADWNEATNWAPEGVPAGINAVVNVKTPNIASITADLLATPVDIIVGTGVGSDGQVNHSAGTAVTGAGNWVYVGTAGGTGTYNLADAAGSGGELTGLGQGAGNLTSGNQMYVGGADLGGNAASDPGATGVLNVNTTGILTIPGALQVGRPTLSTGTVNLDSGSVTTGEWTEFGNFGGTGVLNMSGGTFTKNGPNHFVVGANTDDTVTPYVPSSGTVVQTGGDLNIASGELWVANSRAIGSYTMSGGTIAVNSWVAIGRDGGTGEFNMSGGTITKTGDGSNFIVGASGNSRDDDANPDTPNVITVGTGTMVQTGGLVDVQGGITWVAEQNNSVGVLTLSGTAEFRTSSMTLAPNTGADATLNLDGGTLVAGQIVGGGGAETVNFNGTQIVATEESDTFISDLDTATVDAGGLKIDTNGFDIIVPQSFTGTGGLTKTGAGSLVMAGVNELTGPTNINGGSITIETALDPLPDITVGDGAGLGVRVAFADEQATIANVTLGTAGPSTLTFDLQDFGNPGAAPLDVTGNLSLGGVVTVNILDGFPEVGSFELINYAAKSGGGSFVLGSLPAGVEATLTDNGAGVVTLNITQVNIAVWAGDKSDQWDTTTLNWTNFVTTDEMLYQDGFPVNFDDFADVFDVVLNQTVTPGIVTFDNAIEDYTLSGSGKISGGSGVIKKGAAALEISTANDYTGRTSFEGGELRVATLTNAGVAGPLGAADASPENLRFAGGTLSYTGATDVTWDRGLFLAGAGSGLVHDANLTLNAPVTQDEGGLTKSGTGTLTLAGSPNLLGGVVDQAVTSFGIADGSVVFEGGTNTVGGLFSIAHVADNTVTVTFNNSTLTSTGPMLMGQGANTVLNMAINGTSSVTASNRLQFGWAENAVSNVVLNDSGSLAVPGGWLSVGNGSSGVGTLTLNDSSSMTANVDFNISDVDTSQGEMTLNGESTVVSGGTVYVGKGGATRGELTINGGSFTANNWVSIARFGASIGEINVNGGSLTQTNAATGFNVGEEGTGTLNITGGVVSSAAPVHLGNIDNSTGIINLDGGTLIAPRIFQRPDDRVVDPPPVQNAVSIFNFNGGLLQASASTVDYMAGLDEANVLPGGAMIDTNGNNITIGQQLRGAGGLTKLGAGVLTLSGSNLNSGVTTISEGVISIAPGGGLADSSTLVIDGGAIDVPEEGQVEIVAGLNIGGPLGDGDYDATTHPGAITGLGTVRVQPFAGTGYDIWASGAGLTPGVNDGPEQDVEPGGPDGIANVLEYVLGGNPLASDPQILPQGVINGDNYEFTFNRSDDSELDTTQTFQWSTDLENWNDVAVGAGNSGPDGNGVSVSVAEGTPATIPDVVTITVPMSNAGTEGGIFARLQATKP